MRFLPLVLVACAHVAPPVVTPPRVPSSSCLPGDPPKRRTWVVSDDPACPEHLTCLSDAAVDAISDELDERRLWDDRAAARCRSK